LAGNSPNRYLPKTKNNPKWLPNSLCPTVAAICPPLQDFPHWKSDKRQAVLACWYRVAVPHNNVAMEDIAKRFQMFNNLN
jgi:hypothetical protein